MSALSPIPYSDPLFTFIYGQTLSSRTGASKLKPEGRILPTMPAFANKVLSIGATLIHLYITYGCFGLQRRGFCDRMACKNIYTWAFYRESLLTLDLGQIP